MYYSKEGGGADAIVFGTWQYDYAEAFIRDFIGSSLVWFIGMNNVELWRNGNGTAAIAENFFTCPIFFSFFAELPRYFRIWFLALSNAILTTNF